MQQVQQMAEAYIELAALPVAADAVQMAFPAHLRRSTKALNKVRPSTALGGL